jgi:6-phosphogluconolactonase
MVSDYNETLEKIQGDLSFDLLLLGIGPDGHIASLFPNHHSIKDDSEGFMFLDDSPKPPPERLTASRKMIEKSNVAIVLVFDASKKEAMERYLEGSTSVEECPLKVVNKLKEHIIITDLDIKQ